MGKGRGRSGRGPSGEARFVIRGCGVGEKKPTQWTVTEGMVERTWSQSAGVPVNTERKGEVGEAVGERKRREADGRRANRWGEAGSTRGMPPRERRV